MLAAQVIPSVAPALIRVLVGEKCPMLRTGMAALFADDDRFFPVAVSSDGESFLENVGRKQFDVGIIGWEMPRLDGSAVLRALRGQTGAPRMIVYTGSSNPDLPRQAMMLGAAAFCSKREPPKQLVDTVLAVAGGRMAFPHMDILRPVSDPLKELTWRERELLARLSEGFTNEQIANQIDISLNTVKFHLRNLYDKLGIHNRAQAVAFYLKECRTR